MKEYAVQIEHPQTPIFCQNKMIDVKRGTTKLTPEFCMDILKSTNNKINISYLISLLDDYFSAYPEEKQKYIPVLKGIVNERQHPAILLAKFNDVCQKHNIDIKEDYHTSGSVYLSTGEDYSYIKSIAFAPDTTSIRVDNPKNFPSHHNIETLTALEELHLHKINLSAKNLNLQTPHLQRADFENCTLPSAVDLSTVDAIENLTIAGSDISNSQIVYPLNITDTLQLNNLTLPKKYDFSRIRNVDRLAFCDISFDKKARIEWPQSVRNLNFIDCLSMPEELDLSTIKGIETVSLSHNSSDLKKVKVPETFQDKSFIEYCQSQGIKLELTKFKSGKIKQWLAFGNKRSR